MPADSWFIDAAVQEYQRPDGRPSGREGYVEIDTDNSEVSKGEAGAYVKAWVFVEYPTCSASPGISAYGGRSLGHEAPPNTGPSGHTCDSECDLGHLREDELADGSGGAEPHDVN